MSSGLMKTERNAIMGENGSDRRGGGMGDDGARQGRRTNSEAGPKDDGHEGREPSRDPDTSHAAFTSHASFGAATRLPRWHPRTLRPRQPTQPLRWEHRAPRPLPPVVLPAWERRDARFLTRTASVSDAFRDGRTPPRDVRASTAATRG